MKKNTILLASLLLASASFSQNDKTFKEVQANYLTGKIDLAKATIDKLVMDPANASNAEAWLWKSTIDADIFSKEDGQTKCPTCVESSMAAFKKYQILEPNLTTIADIPFRWKSLINLYTYFFNNGKKLYNEKKYNDAYDEYTKTVNFGKIITEKKIGSTPGAIDTFPILMSAYSAHFAKKYTEAIEHFGTLINLDYKGDIEVEIYNLMLLNCIYNKDKNSFDKYYSISQNKFTATNFEEYKLEYLKQNSSLDDKLKAYNDEDAKGTLSGSGYMEYGVMFSNFTKDEKLELEKNEIKANALQSIAIAAFKKAYAKNNDTIAVYNIGILSYNTFNGLDEKRLANVKAMQDINTNKIAEKDPKKKITADAKTKEQLEPLKKANADLEAQIQANVDVSIEWLEKAYSLLKDKAEKSKVEKNSLRNTVKYLGLLYEFKREKIKAKDPKAYDVFDAKSKFYFALYDAK